MTDGRILTEPAVRRIALLLPLIPSRHAGGTPVPGLVRTVQPMVGGPPAAVDAAARALADLGLVATAADRIYRTADGDRLAKAIRGESPHELHLALIRSGWLGEQIRSLLVLLDVDGDGYRCSATAARRAAPQLVGLLATLPGVLAGGTLRLPAGVGAELQAPWSEWQAPPMAVPGSPEERQQVGDRAELYTVNLERSAYLGAYRDVLWTSRDDYKAGYDIEVVGSPKHRHIEVKGSRGRDVTFVLSDNELRTARRLGLAYEIHFWGGIRLSDEPAQEYRRLRDEGFPVTVPDPATAFADGGWEIAPIGYRVRQLRTVHRKARCDGRRDA